ncbi:thiamine-phosphate kinase [Paludibacterium denitrificans]|uniref:Thiamine-monophosphate kinase n=1 Tax=Paludibacterium denitrificans TaxID=2675226 RepID=A0A844GEX2_9NEIS|nr:thiamine-phosphate kinase [Paludibacterium denitrificans]MTD33821.1 thiamine-phosphate kinase [Paludibacterium denitrificans]
MTEFELIRRYFTRPARQAVLGVGDDAAILRPTPGHDLHVSVDMLVEGRHFFADVDPVALGHKTLAVNLSDMAAMGATPRWVLLSMALPQLDERWLAGFAEGFYRLAERYEVDLVGGDTTRGPLTLSVTVMGEAPQGQALCRAAAQLGDDIWVSGELGLGALAVASRQQGLAEQPWFTACRQRLDYPTPRLELGHALRGVAHAVADVSDGLLADLGHILECSGVGAEVWAECLPSLPAIEQQRATLLPYLAAGGDDYELVFTAPVSQRASVAAIAATVDCRLTRIGRIVVGDKAHLLAADGREISLQRSGFDHFDQA